MQLPNALLSPSLKNKKIYSEKKFLYFLKKKNFLHFVKCNFLALRLKNFLCFSKIFPKKFLIIKFLFPKTTCSEKMSYIFSKKNFSYILRNRSFSYFLQKRFLYISISRKLELWRFQNLSRELPKSLKRKKKTLEIELTHPKKT